MLKIAGIIIEVFLHHVLTMCEELKRRCQHVRDSHVYLTQEADK